MQLSWDQSLHLLCELGLLCPYGKGHEHQVAQNTFPLLLLEARFDPFGDFGQWQTVMEAMVLWQKRRSSGLDSSDRDGVFRDAFPRSALRGQAKATMFPPRSSPARTGKRALRCGNDDITFASGRQPQWLLWLPGRAGGHGSKG